MEKNKNKKTIKKQKKYVRKATVIVRTHFKVFVNKYLQRSSV